MNYSEETICLDKLAYQNAEMPDSLDPAKQMLFLCLRSLYESFKSGQISKETGGTGIITSRCIMGMVDFPERNLA